MTGDQLLIDGEVIVSRSEDSLHEQIAHELCDTAIPPRVLELGFGLGMTARHLRKYDVAEHWIIEGNYWLAAEACSLVAGSVGGADSIVIGDVWERAIPRLPGGFFDRLVFDPYPFDLGARELTAWNQKFSFIARKLTFELNRVLSAGCKIAVINFDPDVCDTEWMQRQFLDVFSVVAKIRPTATVEEFDGIPGLVSQSTPAVWLLGRMETS